MVGRILRARAKLWISTGGGIWLRYDRWDSGNEGWAEVGLGSWAVGRWVGKGALTAAPTLTPFLQSTAPFFTAPNTGASSPSVLTPRPPRPV